MLSKTLSIVPFARNVVKVNSPALSGYQNVKYAHDHSKAPDYKHATMDDLLVPCGSWQENYDNNQRKYNIQLLLGAGVFSITLAVGIYSGALDLYASPPKKPSPPVL